MQNAKNILIAHLEGMGDNILSIPLLHNISASLRNTQLDILVPEGRSDIYHGQKVDRIFEFNDSLPQQVLDTTYDILFDLSTGSTAPSYVYHLKYNYLICLFKKLVQFENEASLSWIQNTPMWQRMLTLLTLMDLKPPFKLDYAFHISGAHLKFARFLRAGIGSEQIICVVPGSGGFDGKRWSPHRFAQLITYLHKTFVCQIVLVGHYMELDLGERIESMLSFGVTNLMGLTNIGTLAALLQDARLVISNDTGTMHLAGILNTPVIALFGPTNPKEYGPLGDTHKIIVADTKKMRSISVDQVISACHEMLTGDD